MDIEKSMPDWKEHLIGHVIVAALVNLTYRDQDREDDRAERKLAHGSSQRTRDGEV